MSFKERRPVGIVRSYPSAQVLALLVIKLTLDRQALTKGVSIIFSEIKGVIDRRILINYKLSPEVAANLLPKPFKPLVHNGFASVGICLIRFKQMRPFMLPKLLGFSSENAAHRFAIHWDSKSQTKTGVYIPRRDTSSFLNSIVGGRLFPGVQHLSEFNVKEQNKRFELSFQNSKDKTRLSISCESCDEFPSENSMFSSLGESSLFFQNGSLGYSPNQRSNKFQSIELKTKNWKVSPLAVNHVDSSYFNNKRDFPDGSIQFDHALLMENIEHRWASNADIQS